MKKIKFLTAVVVATMTLNLFVSCDSDNSETVTQDDLSIVENKLLSVGFNTDNLMTDTVNGVNGYTVEGDIFLTLDQIDAMVSPTTIDNAKLTSEHYRTTNLVSSPRVVNVYMDVEFNSTMQAAFDEALSRYNALNLGLTFLRANSAGADIDVLAEKLKRAPGGYTILGRSAGFPDAQGNPATPIVLNSDVYNPRRGGIPADAVTVIAHEIGHAIGFRHTDYFDRSYSCGSGGNEGDAGVGAIYIPGTPAGPEAGSWMLACSNGTDRPFTSGDVTALTTVY